MLLRLATQEEELLQKSHLFAQLREERDRNKAELEAAKEDLEKRKRLFTENHEKAAILQGSLRENTTTSTGEDEETGLEAEKKAKETEISRLKAEVASLREQLKSTEMSGKKLRKMEEQRDAVSRKIRTVGNVEEELLRWKAAADRLNTAAIPSPDLKALKTEKESLVKQVKAAKSALTIHKKTLSELLSKQTSLQSQHSQAQSSLTQVAATQTKALFQAMQSTSKLGTLLPVRSFHVPVSNIAQQLIAGEDRERTSDSEEICNKEQWEMCLGLEKGTLYESWDVRVRFCKLVWGLEARIVLQIEATTREKLEKISVFPTTAEEYSLSITQLKDTAWVASCTCYKAFASSPTARLRYHLHSSPRNLLFRLPLTSVDLVKPSKSLASNPQSHWTSLSAYETQSPLIGLSSMTLSDIAELLKYHGAFDVLVRQNCPFLSPVSCLGLGAFQSKPALAMVWQREDENWTLAVRSPSSKLRTALIHALTCQFSF